MKKNSLIVKIWILTSVFFLFVSSSNAQVIQEVQNSFSRYQQTALQEKIFVHTDKNIYLPGEILWFKVYCVDGNDHKPLNLSKVVYVDVLDNNQTPIMQTKISMRNGVGDGSIYIPVTVSNGNYLFRAYTNWMKNFNPEFYFEKKITLINPLKSPDAIAKETASAYDIRFFPEGGNLVAGLTSKIAFKAVGHDGKGVTLRGAVINQHNDTLAKFKSLKFGMGNFSFAPMANNTYKAVIYTGNNKPIIKDLPEVHMQGYVLTLTDKGTEQLDIDVTTNTTDANVYLFAHTRQTIKSAASAAVNNGTAHFTIDKSALGEGISNIIIFNEAKQPVCERLYFKRPKRQLFISANADQQQYGLRKKVNLNVITKDAANKPLAADMSVAVYRIDSLQGIDNSNIFNYLWLNADLRGNIESPDYYFTTTDADASEAADNLMLTQGWRRFKWDKLLQNKSEGFSFLPEYNGHIITARIFDSKTSEPAKDIITYLGIPGRRVQLYASTSDSTGHLLYNTKDFYGPSEVIAQSNQLVDSNYRIDIFSPFSEQYSKTPLPEFVFNRNTQKALKEHSLGIQVLNIYSSDNIKRFYRPLIDTSAYFGRPYKTYKLDDFTRFTTMEEDLREYVSEDNIVNSRGHFHIKVLNDRGFLEGDPLVLVDGIPVFNIDKVMAIDPLKIKKLDVIRERYYYGPSVTEGIFSFTSYKGDLGGVELDTHAIVMDYEGLQLSREFYSPVYDTEIQTASRIPDFRNLLYWSPFIANTGKNAISFYTSDQQGKYIGVIQGITSNGDAGSQYFTFDVK